MLHSTPQSDSPRYPTYSTAQAIECRRTYLSNYKPPPGAKPARIFGGPLCGIVRPIRFMDPKMRPSWGWCIDTDCGVGIAMYRPGDSDCNWWMFDGVVNPVVPAGG